MGAHRKVPVRFDYRSESDRERYPLGADTRIEGGRGSAGDKHAIVIDKADCKLYETWLTRVRDGRWRAGSGATWKLSSNRLRPNGWTSADAAGLPILPGLLRWNEVKAGRVDHAIRFTTDATAAAHLWPARHDAGSGSATRFPPMGARFRLRSSYDASGLGAHARVVVKAMKTYGLVLADNGSPWFFQGERNAHWPDRLISDLKRIPASAFVAVDTSSLRISARQRRRPHPLIPPPGADAGAPESLRYGFHRSPRRAFGLWRSLVAHLTGGQGVAGSNPVSPTDGKMQVRATFWL